jgi:hypothetical protein
VRRHVLPLSVAALAAVAMSVLPSTAFPVPQMGQKATIAASAPARAEHPPWNVDYRPTPVSTLTAPPTMTTLVPVASVPVEAAVLAHPSRPSSRSGVAAGTPKPAATGASPVSGCPASVVALIQQYFGSAWRWAVKIAWRESRCQPSAKNARSSASSTFQLLMPLHADQYRAVGCDPVSQRFDAVCSVAAAAHLFHSDGPSPWG